MATAALTARTAGPAEAGRRCPVCQTDVVEGEVVGACPGCESLFHDECWAENGGCGTYGCAHAPEKVAAEASSEPPAAFWGQEEKVCPQCQHRIKVAALRCRFCGRVFADRAPEAMTREGPRSGVGGAGLLFAAGLFPITAPLALVVGAIWLGVRRHELRRWPAMRRVLAILGVAAAAAVTLTLLVALAVYASGQEPR